MDSEVPFGTPWPYPRWRLSRRSFVLAAASVVVLLVALFGFGYPGDVVCGSSEVYNAMVGWTVDEVLEHQSGSLKVHVVGRDRVPGLRTGQITEVSTCRPAGTRTWAAVYVRVAE